MSRVGHDRGGVSTSGGYGVTMIDDIWSGPDSVAPTVVGTIALYAAVLVMVRIAGRRTLAQFSAFDVLVTIAIGSVVAGAALPESPRPLDGIVVVATLLLLQTLLGAVRQHSRHARRYLDFEPETLVEDGEVSTSTSPFGAQLTRGEIESRLRQEGIDDVTGVALVILEPTGKFSIWRGGDV